MLSNTTNNWTYFSEDENILLNVFLESTDSECIVIKYRVTSKVSEQIYLLDKIWDRVSRGPLGEIVFEIREHITNIYVLDDTIISSKALMSTPFGFITDSKYVPCMTLLEPNESIEKYVELPLPLTVYTPYIRDKKMGIPDALPLSFEVGYVLSSDFVANSLEVSKVMTNLGNAYYNANIGVNLQKNVRVEFVAKSVGIIRNASQESSSKARADWEINNSGKWSPWS